MRTLVLAVAVAAALVGLVVLDGTPDADESTAAAAGDAPPHAAFPAVELEHAADNPLRGTLRVTTDGPARLRIRLDDGSHQLTVTETAAPSVEHEIPLLELRPERRYRVFAEIVDGGPDGAGETEIGAFETGPLPDEAPTLTIDTHERDRMASGLTLLELSYRPEEPDPSLHTGWLVALDESGEVVWYVDEPFNLHGVTRLDDGDLLFTSGESGARRLRPTGEVVAEYRGRALGVPAEKVGVGLPGDAEVIDLPTVGFHHETHPLPDGTVLTLSRELRTITVPEPTCPGDDGPDNGDGPGGEGDEAAPPGPVEEGFVADTVVRFDPDSGEILEEHTLWDVLDPLGEDPAQGLLCLGVIDDQYPEDIEVRDWTHANGVIDIDDGATWLVSLRHTSQLVALRAQDEPDGPAGSVRWKIGPDTGVPLEEGGDWFYNPHAPELQPDGTILLYDNGNLRPDVERPYSRAVRYAVEPDGSSVRQVWEEDFGREIYAGFLSDADRLDGGTVLVTHGGMTSTCPTDEEETTNSARVIEVDEVTGEYVFDLTAHEPDSCAGWTVYRSERVPTLYPPEFDVDRSG